MTRPSDSDAPCPDLRALVERAASTLLASPSDEVATRLPPDAASPQEVLGHLIDAAAATHQRILWAWEHEALTFDGYVEEDEGESYEEADWPALVTLWWMVATHLLRTVESIPDVVRRRPHSRHALAVLAWRSVPEDEPATLDDLLRDYEAHLRHHLALLLPKLIDDVPSPHENR